MGKKQKKFLITVSVIAIAALVLSLAAYSSTKVLTYDYSHLLDEVRQPFEEGREFVSLGSGGEAAPGMDLAYENDTLALYVDTSDANIAAYDKRNGKLWSSFPLETDFDGIATPKEKNNMKSQFILKYYDANRKEYVYDSYEKCIELKQFVVESISDGVRITYTVGNMALGVDLIPTYLSEERMEDFILNGLDEATRKYFLSKYFRSKTHEGFWELVASTKTSAINSKRMLDILAEQGYNEDELAFDNEVAGFEMDLQRVAFTIPIEYRIDGDSLSISIPLDRVEESENVMLSNIEFFRMFGAGGLEDEGYMFVPSGSGALINLNNGKRAEDPYSQLVYDLDPLMLSGLRPMVYDAVRLPVFGIKTQDGAFIANITRGESNATLRADVSGRLNSYNTVYPSFSLRNFQRLYMSSVTGSESDMTVIEANRYNGDICVKYMFLAGEENDYAGMAKRYREDLIQSGALTKLEEAGDMPFYLDIIGAVEKQGFVLGIPYDSNAVMTTYKQAEEIAQMLDSMGVKNIQMRYMGWFNGGLYNTTVKKVDMIGKVGNAKALQNLQSSLAQTGGNVYPDVMFVRAPGINPPSSYSVRNEAARSPAGYNWRIAEYDRAAQEMIPMYTQQVFFMNSARALPMQVGKFINAFEKVGINNLSLNDFADLVGGDMYKDTSVPREDAKLVYIEQLGRLSDNYNLIVTGGNAYAFAYTQNIVDAPITHTAYYIIDEGVPFYQMVIHGYIDYAGFAINDRDDYIESDTLLKMIETGAAPHYIFTYEETDKMRYTPGEKYYSTYYKNWIDSAAYMYNQYNNIYSSIRTQTIAAHQKLAEGVYKTTFSGGTSVIVNYNTSAYEADGITIPAKGFVAVNSEGGVINE